MNLYHINEECFFDFDGFVGAKIEDESISYSGGCHAYWVEYTLKDCVFKGPRYYSSSDAKTELAQFEKFLESLQPFEVTEQECCPKHKLGSNWLKYINEVATYQDRPIETTLGEIGDKGCWLQYLNETGTNTSVPVNREKRVTLTNELAKKIGFLVYRSDLK